MCLISLLQSREVFIRDYLVIEFSLQTIWSIDSLFQNESENNETKCLMN